MALEYILKQDLFVLKRLISETFLKKNNEYEYNDRPTDNIFQLFFEHNTDINLIKYILHFAKNKCDKSFIKKNKIHHFVIYNKNLEIIKYTLNFIKVYYPKMLSKPYVSPLNKRTILHELFQNNKDLETIKYILDFTQKNYPSLFLKKDKFGRTILHYLFIHNKDLKTIKYVLDFTQNNYPSLFLEKDKLGDIFLYFYNVELETIKYVLYFTKKVAPSLFLEKNKNEPRFLPYLFRVISDKKLTGFILDFFRNNCPEIMTDKDLEKHSPKNNLVLPFSFQNQN